MSKYLVKGLITISTFIEVEADSEEAARERAVDSPVMTLCNHCADRKPDGEWVTSGELDGTPEIESVEMVTGE